MSEPMSRVTRLTRHRRLMRRFYALTAAGTVVPGLGLIPTRRRKLGLAVLVVFVLAVAGVAVKFFSQGVTKTLLSIGVNRQKLLIVIVLLLAAVLVHCLVIVLTALTARPRGASVIERWTTRVFAALCCCLILFPGLYGARLLEVQRSLVGSVFTGSTTAKGSKVKPEANKADPWAKIPRVNVLLLGSDAGPDRTGVRPDSIMVASINTKNGDATLIGVPRSLRHVPFPDSSPLHALYPNGFDCDSTTDPCWLNKVWSVGVEHKDLYPGDSNPGLTATREAVSATLGLDISHTVVIDLRGFAQLVNAMGGVDVNVKERVCMDCKTGVNGGVIWTGGVVRYIEPGEQHLDGNEALWYARSRALSDDNSRIRRQRCVAGALVRQVNPLSMLANYPSIASAIKGHLFIDIPEDELPAWAELVTRVQGGRINSVALTNDVVPAENPNFETIHELVQKGIAGEKSNRPSSSTTTSSSTASAPSSGSSSPSGSSSTPSSPATTGGLVDLAAAC